jgi:uncharacterized protein
MTTTIYVDADACPVKAEVYKVAARHGVPVKVVANTSILVPTRPDIEAGVVRGGLDVADDWIAERIGPGDVCVTGDIPLAARCLERGAAALRHDGEPFTTASIGMALAMRDLMADIRAANPLGVAGGGRPFSPADRSRFLQSLDRILRAAPRVSPSSS